MVGNQAMSENNRQWHERWSLIASKTEHQTLIPCSTGIDTLSDVGTLGMNPAIHLAGIGGKTDLLALLGVFRHVANLPDHLAHQLVNGFASERSLGRDFSGNDREIGSDQGFARHATEGIVRQAEVEDSIGDLIGHLVGMAHGYGFAGKQVSV